MRTPRGLLGMVTIVALLCGGLVSADDIVFIDDGTYPVGSTPRDILAADFNGDGRLDLATANAYGDSISVLVNNEEYQGFEDSVSFGVGVEPTGLAAGDVNGDGHLDIVTADSMSDAFSVLLGDGEGGFVLHGSFAAGTLPRSVAIGDWNGDGDLDVAVANALSPNVTLHSGDGAGNFVLMDTLSAGLYPHHVMTADFDDNGLADLAVAELDGDGLYIFTGTGSELQFRTYHNGPGGNNLAAADINADGHLDIVGGGEPVFSNMQVLFGNGDGTFSVGVNLTYDFGGVLHYVAADFDNDGHADISTSSYSTAYCYMYKGNDGGIETAGDYYVDDGASAMVTGDFDLDGMMDIAVSDYFDDEVLILKNVTPLPQPPQFIRGDATGDGSVQLGDALAVLNYLFVDDPLSGGANGRCLDAADVDDSGSVSLPDPMALLGYLFANGAPPAGPFPECGEDGAGDLGCDVPTACP